MTAKKIHQPALVTRIRRSMTRALPALACAAMALGAAKAQAADTIKVGVLLPMTGVFADSGRQISNGIKTYMKIHGDTVAGKKIELIIKDTTGAVPEVSKRLAQELVVKDNVDFLTGFSLTPNALAVAPVATAAQKPMVIMNAATSIITTKSPYIARLSYTLAQASEPLAQYAYKSGIRKVFTVVSDYGPGHDSEKAFKKAFIAMGGQVVDELRMPLKSPDFSPFIRRIKDSKPEAVYLFTPAGEAAIGFLKGFYERGLDKAGIKLLTTGDVLDAGVIDALGVNALGVITSAHYTVTHKSPENQKFLATYRSIDPKTVPNGHAVGGYDGMAAIYTVARKLNGNIDGDKAMAVLKNLNFTSPRGPVRMDPATRDLIQNIYICQVKKVNGNLESYEFQTYANVKDPGKTM